LIREIALHGPLAARYGHTPILLDADNVTSLMRGLACACPDFLIELRKHEKIAIALADDKGIEFLDEEGMRWNFGNKSKIHIAAEEHGSGAEAAAAVASWASGASSFAAASGSAAFVYAAVYVAVTVAIAYAMGSIAASLADKPSASGGPADERKSYLFDQAVNLEGQGHPVPLLYGRFKVGSVVISSDVSTERNSIAFNDGIVVDVGATVTGNVFGNDVLGSSLTMAHFYVAGVQYAAGATYSDANVSITIAANGDYSVSGYVEGQYSAKYSATTPTGGTSTADLVIDVQQSFYVYESGDGAGGGE